MGTSTGSVVVKPFTNVIIIPSPSASFCQGDTITLSVAANTSYLWSTSATTNSIRVTSAGTYKVTVTSANGCAGTDTIVVTVNPLPIVSFAGLPASVCADGGNFPLTGTPGGGHFSGSGINNSNFNPANLSGTYTITYTYIEPLHSCLGTATDSVVVKPFANVIITPSGAASFCNGDTINLSVGVYASYIWSTGATTSNINVSSGGTYRVTATAANGCTGTDTIAITVYPAPIVSFSGLPATVCADTSIISLIGSPAGGNFSGMNVSNSTFNPYGLNGTYAIKYTYTETIHGCSDSISHNVIVKPFTSINITSNGPDSFCQGNTVILSIGAYSSYIWSNGSTTNSITVGSANNYKVTATAANGCTGKDSVSITVYPLPTVTFTISPATICSNAGPITLTGSPNGGYFAGPNVANNTFNPTGLSGVQSITYTYTENVHGCSKTDTSTITVNSFPAISLTYTRGNRFCEGLSQTLTIVGSFTNYAWNTGATTASLTESTTGRYTVTVTAANGCTGVKTDSITVLQLPPVSFTGLPIHDTCSLWITYTLTGNPSGGHFNGPGISGNVFNPYNITAGTLTITYYYTDNNGCTGTFSDTAHIINCTGIGEIQDNNGVQIYPNPNDGNFTLHYNFNQPNAILNITDLSGRLVSTFEVKGTAGNQIINTELSNGIYFWQIVNTKGVTANGKIAITK